MSASHRILTASLIAAAMALLPLAGTAQIPPPSPPECVSGCGDDAQPEPPRQRSCRTIEVRYACGTEQRCDDLKGAGIVCVEVERFCTRSEEICD